MTTSQSWRKERGRQTEKAVARWFAAHGWPYAEPVGAGRPGADVTGVPGLHVEVKARRDFSPLAWMRQAVKTRGSSLPFVVVRPDGMGEQVTGDWPVVIGLADLTELLRKAGYGDG
jgi:hypothetical protein